jgi:flagellar basal body P-ring protein FlgI
MKAKILIIAAALGLGVSTVALGDEIQFTTVPEAVRTSVIRETNIPDYSRVTRVYEDQNGVYEVTVRRNTNNEILYVEPTGAIVREQTVALNAPVALTKGLVTQTVTVEQPTVDTFVRDLDQPDRFQLIEKKGIKEIYVDKLTGQRWKVEVRSVRND